MLLTVGEIGELNCKKHRGLLGKVLRRALFYTKSSSKLSKFVTLYSIWEVEEILEFVLRK